MYVGKKTTHRKCCKKCHYVFMYIVDQAADWKMKHKYKYKECLYAVSKLISLW